jgi:hypothetical protein
VTVALTIMGSTWSTWFPIWFIPLALVLTALKVRNTRRRQPTTSTRTFRTTQAFVGQNDQLDPSSERCPVCGAPFYLPPGCPPLHSDNSSHPKNFRLVVNGQLIHECSTSPTMG